MVVGKVDMSTRALENVIRWLDISQFWLWPGVCILCRGDTGQTRDLCTTCLAQLMPIHLPCVACGLPLPSHSDAGAYCGKCLLQPGPIHKAVMRLAWQEPASMLVSQFKYQRKLQYGKVLTALLAECIREVYGDAALPQVLVPVPLHPAKLRQRGYNQALLIARQLGRMFHLPVAHDLLLRTRDTPAQQGLNARERKRNLRGAFMVTDIRALSDYESVAIVDDVVTTMSTATALAKILGGNNHTPRQIHLWALARA